MITITQPSSDMRALNIDEIDTVAGAVTRPPLQGNSTRVEIVLDCSVPGRRCNQFKPTANNGAYVFVGDHWERAKA